MASVTLSSDTNNLKSENNYTATLTVSGTGFGAFSTYYVGLYSGTTLGGEYSVTTDGSGSFNLNISIYPALFPDICRSSSQLTVRVNVGGYNYPATKTFTLTADPTLSNVGLNGDLQGNAKTFIAGVTNITLGFTVETLQYAIPNSVTATYNGNRISLQTTGEAFRGDIDASSLTVGTLVVQITATDSRGTVVSYEIESEVFEHRYPSITSQIFRCDENGVRNATGEYLSITAWANATPTAIPVRRFTIYSITNLDSHNARLLNINITNGETTIIGASEFEAISPDKYYEVELEAVDAFGHSKRVIDDIRKVQRILNFKDGGTGAAFGKLASTASLLDSAWSIHTDGTVTANTPIAISSGGTGATTAAAALANLGAKSIKQFALGASSSVTLTFGQYAHALIIVSGYSVNIKSMFIATSTVSTMTIGTVASSSYITASASGVNLTISNSTSQTSGQIFVMILTGTVEQV